MRGLVASCVLRRFPAWICGVSNVGEYSFGLILYKTATGINQKYAMLTSEDIIVTMVKFADGTVWKTAQ